MSARELFQKILNMLICSHVTFHWHTPNATPPDLSNSYRVKQIPIEFTVKIPPPKRTRVDYGFLPGTNLSKK